MKKKKSAGIALDASEKFVSGLAYVLMTLFALCAILPCLHVVSKAFSKGTYVTAGLVNFWPKGFQLETIQYILFQTDFFNALKNTLIVTGVGTLISLFTSITTAYPLSKPAFRGRKVITLLYVFSMVFFGGMIPAYMVVRMLGILDTYAAMILPFAADEKLLMDISGGADYDCVNVSVNQWRTLVAQGALQPLDDVLEAYGQDILAGNSDTVWDALRGEDGHIYGVPYMYPHSHEIAMFMVARMDLLKAAGINEVPTTIDEFYDCLVTLKEYYGDEYVILAGPFKPNSEGNENWVIPKTIACAFGIYNDWMVDENGQVYYMTEAPGFPDMIAFLTKLYNEGLIDPDWAINTESTLKEKFTSGKAIITCGNRALADFCSAALIENLNLSWDDLGYISALKGSDGTCKYQSTEAFNWIGCVPKSSKNLADVVNWWNLRIKDQLFIAIGEEGVHFNYDENGEIEPINPIFAEERGNSYWYMDVTNQKEYEFQWPSRVRKSEGQWHSFSAVTMDADQSIFVPNTFAFMPAKDNYTKYNTALFNDLNDYIIQIMSGTRTINDLDTFMSDWTNAGGESVRGDLQGWYDEFYK